MTKNIGIGIKSLKPYILLKRAIGVLGVFYKSEQFINCAAHFINP